MTDHYHIHLMLPVDAVIEASSYEEAERRGLLLIGRSKLVPETDGLLHAAIGVPDGVEVRRIRDAEPPVALHVIE